MIRKLAGYIGRYKTALYAVPLVVIIDVVLELSIPLLMSKIVDVGIAAKDVSYIARIGLWMAVMALAAMALGILNMQLSTYASMGFGANLRDALFDKVEQFSFTNIDQFSTASLVTRLTNDANNLQVTLMMATRILLRAPLTLVVALFLAYGTNPELSKILAAAIVVLSAAVVAILLAATKRFGVVQERVDAVNSRLQENLIGQRVVKAFDRAEFETVKFQVANDALTNAFIRAVSVAILNMPVMMAVMNVSTLAIIWRGGRLVSMGTLGAGALLSLLAYVFQILNSFMMISMVVIMWARAQASGIRVLEVLEAPVDIIDKPAQAGMPSPQVTAGRVEFRDAAFKYSRTGTGAEVLSGINFAAEPGQVVAIVGGTGSGKSTLVHLIPRLYDVSAGAVLVDGCDVRDYALDALRSGIGVVLQKNTLFSGTIRENLLWGKEDATQQEIEAACEDAQAHDFIMSFPGGYDTDLGQGGVNLSGGQKQRLCIARAILRRPRVLILDDSTSAVDSATEAEIRESFDHSLAGTTVFIIAQRISSVRDADKIVVLDDGKVIGVGTHQSLLATNAVYQEIYQSQQEGVRAG